MVMITVFHCNMLKAMLTLEKHNYLALRSIVLVDPKVKVLSTYTAVGSSVTYFACMVSLTEKE